MIKRRGGVPSKSSRSSSSGSGTDVDVDAVCAGSAGLLAECSFSFLTGSKEASLTASASPGFDSMFVLSCCGGFVVPV